MRSAPAVVLAALLIGAPAVAPASSKPCRDAGGRVISCAKPAKATAKRCKDAAGRFVPCGKPGARPAGLSPS